MAANPLHACTHTLHCCCRCDIGSLVLDRPSTADRQQGQVAMTVLQAAPELLQATGKAAVAAAAAAADAAAIDQQQQSGFSPRPAPEPWQAAGRSQPGQQQTQQLDSQQQQQLATAAAQQLALKVRRRDWLCTAPV